MRSLAKFGEHSIIPCQKTKKHKGDIDDDSTFDACDFCGGDDRRGGFGGIDWGGNEAQPSAHLTERIAVACAAADCKHLAQCEDVGECAKMRAGLDAAADEGNG